MNQIDTLTTERPGLDSKLSSWYVSLGDLPSNLEAQITVLRSNQWRALRLHGEPGQALPATASRSCCGVVFDGVLYNGPELVAGLDTPPNSSDADVILQAYLHWGSHVLHKLEGRFALILWDSTRDVLFCARDPLGLYPLFYADTGSEFLVSTSIEALLQHKRLDKNVDRTVLVHYLSRRWPQAGETFYQNIKRLPPGHLMRLESTGCQIYRYWDPAPAGTPIKWLDEYEAEYRFGQVINRVIERFLDVGTAGIFLSGGLDSVSVAAIARETCRRRGMPDPWALSLIFPHPTVNEKEIQAGVARSLGLPQVLLDFDDAVGPKGLLSASLEMSGNWPAPLQNVWNPAYYRLGLEGKQRGCRIILTGGGGDEWLTVDPIFAADLLRNLKIADLVWLIRNMQRSYRLPILPLTRNVLWSNGLSPILKSRGKKVLRRVAPGILQARKRRQKAYTPPWMVPDAMPHLDVEIDPLTDRGDADGFYIQQARQFLEHPLLSLEMEESFETERRMGVQLGMPYWDVELVDLLYRTPPQVLNKGGRNKGLVRYMLQQRFPDLGFERQKKVISLDFFRSQLLRDGAQVWKAFGGATALADLGIVNATALNTTVERVLSNNDPANAPIIWETLSVEAWLRPRV
jgi:asparagine synthase (glutamine-hydrolysing)